MKANQRQDLLAGLADNSTGDRQDRTKGDVYRSDSLPALLPKQKTGVLGRARREGQPATGLVGRVGGQLDRHFESDSQQTCGAIEEGFLPAFKTEIAAVLKLFQKGFDLEMSLLSPTVNSRPGALPYLHDRS